MASSATNKQITLSSHRMTDGGSATRAQVASAAVPTGRGLSMSPSGPAVTLAAEGDWSEGDLVPFTLHFEHGGAVSTSAVVIRPTS